MKITPKDIFVSLRVIIVKWQKKRKYHVSMEKMMAMSPFGLLRCYIYDQGRKETEV